MTINTRDAQSGLKAKTYKLDDGSCQMSASYTMYLDDKPTTYHWTASTGSVLSGDDFTFTIISMDNGVAKGTFSGTLRVPSTGGDLETFREITKGEFSLPFGK